MPIANEIAVSGRDDNSEARSAIRLPLAVEHGAIEVPAEFSFSEGGRLDQPGEAAVRLDRECWEPEDEQTSCAEIGFLAAERRPMARAAAGGTVGQPLEAVLQSSCLCHAQLTVCI